MLKRDSNGRFVKGSHPPTEFEKGRLNPNVGKTYEEIYGESVARNLKEKQRDSHMGIQAKENHPMWKGGIDEYVCEFCNKKFKPEKRSSHTPRFCSWVCWEGWRSEHFKGDEHPSWKGGITYFPYCEKFNFEFKERVREFFHRKCYLCGKTEEEENRRLAVHHINYNKKVCCDDIPSLFVPLCARCHGKTHTNRKEWEEFFTASLNYLTGGECFILKKNDGVKFI